MAIGTPVERYAQVLSAQTATTVFSPASTVAAGTVAVLATLVGNSAKVPSSVTDSVGNTWTVDVTANDGTRGAGICSAEIVTQITSSDTITITWSTATSRNPFVTVQEVSGLATSSPFDKSVTGTGAAATAFTAGPTATLSQASEIAFAVFQAGGVVGFTVGDGWTLTATQATNGVLEYQSVSATTALTATATAGTATTYAGAVATYKAASSSSLIPRGMLLGVG